MCLSRGSGRRCDQGLPVETASWCGGERRGVLMTLTWRFPALLSSPCPHLPHRHDCHPVSLETLGLEDLGCSLGRPVAMCTSSQEDLRCGPGRGGGGFLGLDKQDAEQAACSFSVYKSVAGRQAHLVKYSTVTRSRTWDRVPEQSLLTSECHWCDSGWPPQMEDASTTEKLSLLCASGPHSCSSNQWLEHSLYA